MKRSLLLGVLGVLFCGMFVVVKAMVDDMDVEVCNAPQSKEKLFKNARISLAIKAVFDVNIEHVCTEPESAKKLFSDDRIKSYMESMDFNEFVVTLIAKKNKDYFEVLAQVILDSRYVSNMMISLFFLAAINKSSINVLKQISAKGVIINQDALEMGFHYSVNNKHYDLMILILENFKIHLKTVKKARWRVQKNICRDIKEFLDEWIDRRELNPF